MLRENAQAAAPRISFAASMTCIDLIKPLASGVGIDAQSPQGRKRLMEQRNCLVIKPGDFIRARCAHSAVPSPSLAGRFRGPVLLLCGPRYAISPGAGAGAHIHSQVGICGVHTSRGAGRRLRKARIYLVRIRAAGQDDCDYTCCFSGAAVSAWQSAATGAVGNAETCRVSLWLQS